MVSKEKQQDSVGRKKGTVKTPHFVKVCERKVMKDRMKFANVLPVTRAQPLQAHDT